MVLGGNFWNDPMAFKMVLNGTGFEIGFVDVVGGKTTDNAPTNWPGWPILQPNFFRVAGVGKICQAHGKPSKPMEKDH